MLLQHPRALQVHMPFHARIAEFMQRLANLGTRYMKYLKCTASSLRGLQHQAGRT